MRGQYDAYRRDYERFKKEQFKKQHPIRTRLPLVLAGIAFLAILGAAGWFLAAHPEIIARTPAGPIELTPGEYTVGEHIPEGRYLITTDGMTCHVETDDFMALLSESGDGYTCNLEDGEELRCTNSITLTPTD